MNILLTGATGYIGKRLLPILVAQGHHVICCVRDPKRFNPPDSLLSNIEVLKIDLLDTNSLEQLPKNIDAAYYLVHSMSASKDYLVLEQQAALNFRFAIDKTKVTPQLIERYYDLFSRKGNAGAFLKLVNNLLLILILSFEPFNF